MAYESERLKRVGTRDVKLGLFELNLDDEERDKLFDDPEDAFTEFFQKEGQEVNGVLVAASNSVKGPIFFPEGPAPIVAHVEFPDEVASMWIVYRPKT